MAPLLSTQQKLGETLWSPSHTLSTRNYGIFRVGGIREYVLSDGSLVSVTSGSVGHGTAALFTGTSLYSRRVFVPLNGCGSNVDLGLPSFYCVHSVSGTAGTDYSELAEKLEPHIRVYGIQAPPALMHDIEFGKSVETIAAFYADALDDFQPKGTLYIGGYCAGAVIALAMVNNLRDRGREVGPLVAIDGVPENTPFALARWRRQYWAEFAHNAMLRTAYPKLMGNRSIRSVAVSIYSNLSAITKNMLGMNRAQRFGGGYSVKSVLDVSRYPPVHLSFINRLFNAIFEYTACQYSGDVVVYEAAMKPALLLPQIGRIWRNLAPRAQVIPIMGTHRCMMRAPYVNALAHDLLKRLRLHAQEVPRAAMLSNTSGPVVDWARFNRM